MNVEVLVATMHQTDFSKIEEMNIQSDVVFANQADCQAYSECVFEHGRARMITTDQRGVGRNRNLALLYAKRDILLFSDDDMVYEDGYAEHVIHAFEETPEADVVVFSLDYAKDGVIYKKSRHAACKLPVWKCLKYGTARIAVRREAIEKANIFFHTQFGGGCKYSSGEDSLFLMDCYRKGLTVYANDYCIGYTQQNGSTWFEGYTEKYFRDKGSWLACAMPKLCRIIAPLLAVKWRDQNKTMGIFKKWQLMNEGITLFRREEK